MQQYHLLLVIAFTPLAARADARFGDDAIVLTWRHVADSGARTAASGPAAIPMQARPPLAAPEAAVASGFGRFCTPARR